ncbi:ABC transporter substrate-binding protein [Paenibacillus eucommiae]|uniref:Peptide/nickel transport system substrate-binding protein n=1 Tax=Paenibacillus eucommiae TaxID=1355755 RepID=A0ABS4IU18_9BACL|nr:ABC transporter substrate-binding protein [Paenibacillus eucommiae]MBP1991065.1 peptide/nickel transport system substrate-binding protein [Paenibacillus eucommiae]
MKRWMMTMLSVVMVATLLISCSSKPNTNQSPSPDASVKPSDSPDGGKASDGILRIGGGPQEKFQSAWGDYGGFVRTSLFRRLLMLDTNMQPVHKDLAADYTISDDQMTYTFTIHDGVKWHDGEPFTAEDVRWSIQTAIKSVSINSVFAGAFGKIVGAKEFKEGTSNEVPGLSAEGNVVTIKLTEPVGAFLLTMAQWPPYPKHLLEKEDPLTLHLAAFWEKPIGNGPYKLTEVVPNNYAIMEINPDFYGDKPQIEKIMLQTLTEDQIVTKAQAQELDYYSVMDLAQMNEIKKTGNYDIHEVDVLYIRYLMANLQGPAESGKKNEKIADLRLRQALLYAIDRKSMADQLYPGQATAIQTKVPNALPEFNKNTQPYDYDPEKAKQLLKDSGYDVKVPLSLAYFYTDQATIDLIDTIKYYWEQIGLKIETTLLQGNLVELIYAKRDYDFIYAGLSAMAMEEVYGIFHSDNAAAAGVMGNNKEAWDSAVDALRRESDPAKRQEALNKLQEMEAEYLWQLPLFAMKQYTVVNKNRLETAGVYGNEWTNYDRKLGDWKMK